MERNHQSVADVNPQRVQRPGSSSVAAAKIDPDADPLLLGPLAATIWIRMQTSNSFFKLSSFSTPRFV